MTTIALQFWGGARAAAGVDREEWEARSVAEALELAAAARSDPRFDRVVAICTILVDGAVLGPAGLRAPRDAPVTAECLPPFAGGS
jgi:molybdopterin synthase sulfur carrier subunit